jgi:hypothetical protein
MPQMPPSCSRCRDLFADALIGVASRASPRKGEAPMPMLATEVIVDEIESNSIPVRFAAAPCRPNWFQIAHEVSLTR